MKKFILSLSTLWVLSISLNAQSISGIINNYAKVSSIDACLAKLTVSDTVGFHKGMPVVIIQMNGASIKSSNNSEFGQLTDLGMTGKYEINEVDSVSNKEIFLRFYPKNEYNTQAAVQIVTYPKFGDVTVSDTVRAKNWSGETGGIIAFSANSVTLNAPILASESGFRGGSVVSYDNCQALEIYNSYHYSINETGRTNGAVKGEGIAAQLDGKECGRGPQATGGGGGNNHKAGGGGGAHLTAGGIGGEQRHVSNTRNCNGDYPGWGGIGIGGDDNTRLFLGGGGGAGHSRQGGTSQDTRGATGGGIIFLTANTLTGNGKTVAANGGSALLPSAQGAGGGGAGGTIIFNVRTVSGLITVEAKGGKGGDSGSSGDYDLGTGGGGAGGRVLISNSTNVTLALTGGEPGRNAIQRSSLGAAKGENGVSKVLGALEMATDSISRQLTIIQQPVSPQLCEFRTTTLSVLAKGLDVKYRWRIDKGDGAGFRDLEGDTTFIGVASPTLIINRVTTRLNPFLFDCVVSNSCGSQVTVLSHQVGLNITPVPIPLFTAAVNFNTVSFFNGSSNGTSYLWDFGDNQTSTQANPVHTFAAQGNYKVVLKVINQCDTIPFEQTIILNQRPKAGFEATSNDYCVPAAVRFANASSNNVTAYRWIFTGGEPAISTESNPIVTYGSAGIYPVSLIVTNANGSDTLIRQNYIRTNSAPITRYRIERVGNSATISFINESLFATTYEWDFGDATPLSTDANPQHTYASTGTYVVRLTARNQCGVTTKLDTLVLGAFPTAKISANKTDICSGESVNFFGQNPTNVISWFWTFSGGNPNTSRLSNPVVNYSAPGIYSVSLRVSNATGDFTTVNTDYIKVTRKPIANFKVDTIDKATVTFKNLSDSLAEGTTYSWNFYTGRNFTGFNPTPIVFPRNGNYPITLQAYTLQCSDVKQLTVTIFVVGTNDPNTEGGLTAYPNPTQGRVLLKFEQPIEENIKLTLTNATGQVVSTHNLSRSAVQEFDWTHLPQGVYLLQFQNSKAQFQRRILKL